MAEGETKSVFWERLGYAAEDIGASASALGSAGMSAYHAYQDISQGLVINNDWTLFLSLLVFLVSGLIAIIQAKRRERKSRQKAEKAENDLEKFRNDFEKYKNEQTSIKSEAQTGGTALSAGRDIVNPVISTPPIEIGSPNIVIGVHPVRQGTLPISWFTPTSNKPIMTKHFPSTIFEVQFSNNPKNRTLESSSRGVVAKIAYEELNGAIIKEVDGIWGDAVNSYITKTVTLPFNGVPQTLFLAAKFITDRPLFMFCDGIDGGYFDRQNKDSTYKLSDGEKKDIRIKVHLIGERLDKEYQLILHFSPVKGESIIDIV